MKVTSDMLRRRAAGESVRSIARRAGVAPSTMSHGFKVHDTAVAAKAERRIAAREAKAEKQRQVAERKSAWLATQPAPQVGESSPAGRSGAQKQEGGMTINRRALRRLNGLGSETDAYIAWLNQRKNLDARLIGKE